MQRDDRCRATSGHWGSVYEGKTITDASDLSLDHMVPLANAWRSGAKGWEPSARDSPKTTHPQLLAVSAATRLPSAARSE
ncbi:hypothetical protein F8R89_01405 [Streptomyces sp. SS1-1]|uniref:hypothetical protein n=1 Tax=Streptomyces sp. SS1-1 TaxID=2651869 RepID=UPI001250CF11|nr:hypothetical protein [Streptomyces sp. SS1-1]KAB2970836.1 hypothetical protein F8R89_01405 [Streptomyces sp. SS1-1]